ncbi:MAG: MBL fold metallo-hydrolase [Planctomycetota bacterium]
MPLELTFLGTGTSAGVPMIGCKCPVCTSDDPRDRRDRASVLVRNDDPGFDPGPEHTEFNPAQAGVRQFLIDTSPDLRHQAVRARLSRVDGVFVTHTHADHIFGLDDLRRFNAVMKSPIDVFAEPSAHDTLGSMFRYIFEPHKNVNKSFVAHLLAHRVEPGQPLDRFGATWTPLRLLHGRLPILGFRVDHGGTSLAYCTDVSSIPPETYPLLRDLDVLVIDALRERHHPTHLTTDQALAVIDELRPGRAYLTHLAHDHLHADLAARLPANVEPAYDGLVVSVAAPATSRAD